MTDVLLRNYDSYMHLKIFVDDASGNELKNMYKLSAEKHNNKCVVCPQFIDAGFDLYAVPSSNQNSPNCGPIKIDFNIVCSEQMVCDSGKTYNTGYFVHPRSSLSKTKLRLANSTGIIDAGYRGHLIGMLDVLELTWIHDYDRLLQICAPGLKPIFVEVVDNIEDLGEQTLRGRGGFGSTGR